MNLSEASSIANEVIEKLSGCFVKFMVCGSIRREKPEVKDIDIVAIVKQDQPFGELTLSHWMQKLDPEGAKQAKTMGKQGSTRYVDGNDIKRFHYRGMMIDIYVAQPDEFETLCLIRTGSTEFNKRLTTLARGNGMKLFASGKGLCVVDWQENPIKVIASTEHDIMMKLLGRYVEPKDRGI